MTTIKHAKLPDMPERGVTRQEIEAALAAYYPDQKIHPENMRRVIERMRAALLAAAQFRAPEETWQPIETAPRDKTTVALLRIEGDYRRHGVGFYMPLTGWVGWNYENDGSYSGGPTHWCPLPSPPGAQS